MENILTSAGITIPIFLTMVIGKCLQQTSLLNESLCVSINGLIFHLFLPCSIFNSIYSGAKVTGNSVRTALFVIIATAVIFVGTRLIAPKLEPLPQRQGVLLQAVFRGNPAIYISVMASLYGTEHTGILGQLLIVVVPLYSGLAVLSLSLFSGESFHWHQTFKSLAQNALILSSLFALFLKMTDIAIPALATDLIGEFGQMAAPLSFLTLGAAVRGVQIKRHYKVLLIGLSGKLIVVPAIAILAAWAVGIHGMELAAVMLIFATPTASSSYPMTCAIGGDRSLAGEFVALSSAAATVTLGGWIFILLTLGAI